MVNYVLDLIIVGRRQYHNCKHLVPYEDICDILVHGTFRVQFFLSNILHVVVTCLEVFKVKYLLSREQISPKLIAQIDLQRTRVEDKCASIPHRLDNLSSQLLTHILFGLHLECPHLDDVFVELNQLPLVGEVAGDDGAWCLVHHEDILRFAQCLLHIVLHLLELYGLKLSSTGYH